MAEQLAPGNYELESTDNFDEYMKTLGVGYATRVIGNKLKPSQEISIQDGVWNIKTKSSFKTVEVSFKLNEPFEETTADGRTVKTTCTVDGSKLIQSQKGEIDSVLVRDFNDSGFKMTLTAKEVVCTRIYKRPA